MKYLGIDYGTKRIGIAVSDETGEFAFPKAILHPKFAVQEIALLVQKEGIAAIALGQSMASNGAANDIAPVIEKFKSALEVATGVPVSYQYEGGSSFEAHRYQTKAGARDDSAAAIILQRFLDKNRK